jgi:hypothetical protein
MQADHGAEELFLRGFYHRSLRVGMAMQRSAGHYADYLPARSKIKIDNSDEPIRIPNQSLTRPDNAWTFQPDT